MRLLTIRRRPAVSPDMDATTLRALLAPYRGTDRDGFRSTPRRNLWRRLLSD